MSACYRELDCGLNVQRECIPGRRSLLEIPVGVPVPDSMEILHPKISSPFFSFLPASQKDLIAESGGLLRLDQLGVSGAPE